MVLEKPTWFGNAQSIMHIIFQLYDVLSFNTTVVIKVLANVLFLKLNNQFFSLLKCSACMNMLLG